MILHIVDDEKFINFAFNLFEKVYPGQNKLLCFSRKKEYKFIKGDIENVSIFKLLRNKFLNSMSEYEFIVLHMLNLNKLWFLKKIDSKVKIVWLGWGVDYYNLVYKDETQMYLHLTNELYKRLYAKKKIDLKNTLKKMIFGKVELKNVLNKINFFGPILPNEFDLISKIKESFYPSYVPFSYISLESNLLKGIKEKKIDGDNILIGNSASLTNNHLEIFESLKKMNLSNRKVIVPLSYGNMDYRSALLDEVSTLLGKNFFPLLNFMKIEEYNSIINTCSVVIMNHLRQQGLGNIVCLMYLGAKVFLNPINPLYEYLKNENAFVYSIQDLNSIEDIKSCKLSSDEISINREILLKNWSDSAVELKTSKLLNLVNCA